MIHDLDKTLETLLKRELPADIVKEIAISFVPPDEKFPPQAVKLPALDLFLYDIRENRDLRDNEWIIERQQQERTATKRRAPVRIDCSYLVTAWTTDTLDEHRVLGAAMNVLLRYGTLPPDVLQGVLTTQEFPLPTVSLQPGREQSMPDLWRALGGKPKAALHYTVTLAIEPTAPVATERLVGEKGNIIDLKPTEAEENLRRNSKMEKGK